MKTPDAARGVAGRGGIRQAQANPTRHPQVIQFRPLAAAHPFCAHCWHWLAAGRYSAALAESLRRAGQ